VTRYDHYESGSPKAYISVVILSFNSANSIGRCLDNVVAALKPFRERSEVFVVDNGSVDTSVGLIERRARRYDGLIKPVFLASNTGTTYSRNLALKRCSGQYILVLDADAYITHEAVNNLVAYIEKNPVTGIAAPRLVYGTGNFQLSCDVFPTILQKAMRFFFLRQIENSANRLKDATEPLDVDYSISACWLMRRDVFQVVGLFDEKIFYSPEDVDYCLRIWKAGFRVTYVPSATVIHDAQELSRGFRLTKFHFSHLRGLIYLLRKHRYFWGRRNLYRRINRSAEPTRDAEYIG